MANKLILKRSSVASKVPLATDLEPGELAVNLVDQKLYTKKTDGTVILVGSGISGADGADLTGQTQSATPFETALGVNAGTSNTGVNGTFLGYAAGQSHTTGTNSTFVGFEAGLNTNTGASNTYVGSQAGRSNINGHSNTAIGYQANYTNSNGIRNAIVGMQAMYSNVGGASSVAIGWQSLYANTSGNYNIAVGATSLLSNTTGASNVALGQNALRLNTTASFNAAVGAGAMYNNTTGTPNIGIGYYALYSNSTGSYNVASGYESLYYATGNANTAFGHSTGRLISTGVQNTLLGAYAGYTGTNNLSTGSNNTLIGYNAAASSASVNNEITLGNSSIATLRCQVTTITSLSDERDKTNIVDLTGGLSIVNAVRPVAFDWNTRDGAKVGEHDTGFIAQQLKQAQQDTGVTIPGLVYESDPEKLEAGYGKLLPFMVKAIQELSAKVAALESEITFLKGS